MRQMREFLRLPTSQRSLLMQASVLVSAIRIGLWLLPFRIVRGTIHQIAPVPEVDHSNGRVADQVTWAVRVASRYFPRATCLTQALATQVLLHRRGYPTSLRIGVTKEANGKLAAHAWVECQGRIVIGGSAASVAQYMPLPLLEGEQA